MSLVVVAVILLALCESLSAATSYSETCVKIARAISPASQMYYAGSPNYIADMGHFMASSEQNATCSVEPGTTADVGAILKIIQTSRTPFAIKGGGHTSNPGFSSTLGVHIAMSRFSEVTYDNRTQTATIGAGLTWGQVYSRLEPYGVTVAGGRVGGVGVAGFILGGGYSWRTNQYGLAIDTVQAFELVSPNGTVINVTSDSNPDLFFGLRGGFNNFGIVTRFVLKTFPQTAVWGGQITYQWGTIDEVIAAINKFSDTNTDPKAAIIPNFAFLPVSPVLIVNLIVFYDGPLPPPGVFDDFLKIPFVGSLAPQPFAVLASLIPAYMTSGLRGTFSTVSLTNYSVDILTFIKKELVYYSQNLTGAAFLSYNVEPFSSSLYSHSTIPSAYPPTRSQGFTPFNLYFAWSDPNLDKIFHDAVAATTAAIKTCAIAGGQQIALTPLYNNYASLDTPLEHIYGDNLGRLKGIKATYDPQNVMGLAGGFKFNGTWGPPNSELSRAAMNLKIPPFVIVCLLVLSLML